MTISTKTLAILFGMCIAATSGAVFGIEGEKELLKAVNKYYEGNSQEVANATKELELDAVLVEKAMNRIRELSQNTAEKIISAELAIPQPAGTPEGTSVALGSNSEPSSPPNDSPKQIDVGNPIGSPIDDAQPTDAINNELNGFAPIADKVPVLGVKGVIITLPNIDPDKLSDSFAGAPRKDVTDATNIDYVKKNEYIRKVVEYINSFKTFEESQSNEFPKENPLELEEAASFVRAQKSIELVFFLPRKMGYSIEEQVYIIYSLWLNPSKNDSYTKPQAVRYFSERENKALLPILINGLRMHYAWVRADDKIEIDKSEIFKNFSKLICESEEEQEYFGAFVGSLLYRSTDELTETKCVILKSALDNTTKINAALKAVSTMHKYDHLFDGRTVVTKALDKLKLKFDLQEKGSMEVIKTLISEKDLQAVLDFSQGLSPADQAHIICNAGIAILNTFTYPNSLFPQSVKSHPLYFKFDICYRSWRTTKELFNLSLKPFESCEDDAVGSFVGEALALASNSTVVEDEIERERRWGRLIELLDSKKKLSDAISVIASYKALPDTHAVYGQIQKQKVAAVLSRLNAIKNPEGNAKELKRARELLEKAAIEKAAQQIRLDAAEAKRQKKAKELADIQKKAMAAILNNKLNSPVFNQALEKLNIESIATLISDGAFDSDKKAIIRAKKIKEEYKNAISEYFKDPTGKSFPSIPQESSRLSVNDAINLLKTFDVDAFIRFPFLMGYLTPSDQAQIICSAYMETTLKGLITGKFLNEQQNQEIMPSLQAGYQICFSTYDITTDPAFDKLLGPVGVLKGKINSTYYGYFMGEVLIALGREGSVESKVNLLSSFISTYFQTPEEVQKAIESLKNHVLSDNQPLFKNRTALIGLLNQHKDALQAAPKPS